MFQKCPTAEHKKPTTVKLTRRQRRQAEEKARELGISTHAFYLKAIAKALDEACRGERVGSG